MDKTSTQPKLKKRIFSGIQPTGDSLHLGNYIGAIKNWIELQNEYDCIFSIVNLHSLTVLPDPNKLKERTLKTAAQYLAAGIDPNKAIIFVQGDVKWHTSLAWDLQCITSVGEASRMTQYKDKSQKLKGNQSVGLFTYPTLMAADILLYDTDAVPVGEDQRQHLELTRVLARKLNAKFGINTAVEPKPLIAKDNTAKIQDLQNPQNKMSKSAQSNLGLIELLDEPKLVEKKIKSAVTDSLNKIQYDVENQSGLANLLSIYSALSGKQIDDIVVEYSHKMYGHLKVDLAQLVIETFNPIREKTLDYLNDKSQLIQILKDGASRANAIAEPIYKRFEKSFGLKWN